MSSIKYYSIGIEKDNKYWVGYFYRAEARMKVNEYTLAINDLDCVISINPNHFSAYVKSICLLALGDSKGASKELEKAIKLRNKTPSQILQIKHY